MIDKKRMDLFLINNDRKIKSLYPYDIQCTARSEIYNFFKKTINENKNYNIRLRWGTN